ncbi:MAG TPA: dockerin type I repeat-containing protein [Tepidisphaeraceae bacterium]
MSSASVAAILLGATAALGQINTGSFTAPSTSAYLSVDINGGIIASNDTPTEGWDQVDGDLPIGADPYGVTWSSWGGPTYDGGDGTQLPDSGSSVGAASISKTFSGMPTSAIPSGSLTATLSAPGSTSSYGNLSNGLPLNGRDRGSGSNSVNNWAQGYTGPMADIDMWRDFEFAGGSGSNVQSSNFLQLQLSGLKPNASYTILLYTFDALASVNHVSATATPYQQQTSVALGWWAPQTGGAGNETFTPPADEQVTSFSASTSLPAPISLNIISNGQGIADVWDWGGSGTAGDENASSSYLNGFQVQGGTPLLLGDTNGDGVVDATDLATLQADMGQTFTNVVVSSSNVTTNVYNRGYAIGDFNGDGKVDADDFALFELGAAEYDKSQGMTVPEPGCIALLALAAPAAWRRQRRV